MNSNETNDGRSEIDIDITDDEFLRIAKMAHERDITFNKMVEYILEEEIKRSKVQEETIDE